jgi:hypothetical protein
LTGGGRVIEGRTKGYSPFALIDPSCRRISLNQSSAGFIESCLPGEDRADVNPTFADFGGLKISCVILL